MKILIVGSGGREHALGWSSAKARLCRIIAAPGNPGLAELSRRAHQGRRCARTRALAAREQVGLVVIGPEAAAVAGLADALKTLGVPCFGPSKAAAELEGSKPS